MDWLDVHTMLRSIFVRLEQIYTDLNCDSHWQISSLTFACLQYLKIKNPDIQISNWTLLRNYLLTEHENRLWLQLNSLFSCTSLDAWMITSTAARIELLVCKANARSFICAHCVQSADLQVCCPTSFRSLPNALSPEGPAAVGVDIKNTQKILKHNNSPL